MEIGSEFWLDTIEEVTGNKDSGKTLEWLTRFGNFTLTNSGRGALYLVLRNINPSTKTALLPAYICTSVLDPFQALGYKCYFYDLNEDLSPDLSTFPDEEVGVFFHMGYFGFPTNDLRQKHTWKNTILIEDVTHTLFSKNTEASSSDYYIGSIRKWFGIPSGGFAASRHIMKEEMLPQITSYYQLRKKALYIKFLYMSSKDISLKHEYQGLFFQAEEILNEDPRPYKPDELSQTLLQKVSVEQIILKRQENYNVLQEGLKTIPQISPLFQKITHHICPLFFPILVDERDEFQRQLAEMNIFCPVHWPVPFPSQLHNYQQTKKITEHILSIPCDQRYTIQDMHILLKAINSIAAKYSTIYSKVQLE